MNHQQAREELRRQLQNSEESIPRLLRLAWKKASGEEGPFADNACTHAGLRELEDGMIQLLIREDQAFRDQAGELFAAWESRTGKSLAPEARDELLDECREPGGSPEYLKDTLDMMQDGALSDAQEALDRMTDLTSDPHSIS